jgi:hypothetical protein
MAAVARVNVCSRAIGFHEEDKGRTLVRLSYPESMPSISPTLEGFRAAFRRPLFTLGEITWRWVFGGTATALFFFGLFEYLNTLPVSNGELFFLRTRQPYLVAQALAHILRGSLNRAAISAILAAMLLALIWIIAASLGRVATVRGVLEYFRDKFAGDSITAAVANDLNVASNVAGYGVDGSSALQAVMRLNFLRVAVALSALIGFAGATILAGFASPAAHPRPGLVFVLLVPMLGVLAYFWWALNWLLSLAAVFAVRDGDDALGSISSAVSLLRERFGAVTAVSSWTGVAHLVVFIGASTVVGIPLSTLGLLPWRLVALAVILVTLVYLSVADWLYMARLAGYVCIAEMPEALLRPLPPPTPLLVPPVSTGPPLQTTIDRDESILSDVPGLIVET